MFSAVDFQTREGLPFLFVVTLILLLILSEAYQENKLKHRMRILSNMYHLKLY